MNYKLILLAGFVVILAVGFGSAYLMLNVPGVSSSHGVSSTPSSPTSPSSSSSSLYFLTLTQKGIAMVINPFSASSFLGFQHVVNISLNVPDQVFYWEEVPYGDTISLNQYVFVPLNNGTVEVFNSTNMKVVDTLSVGDSIGFIGVAYSPHMNRVAIADGPSGVVEVVNAHTLQVEWKDTFTSNGKTMYPCDVRWTPDGSYLLVPMKLNDSIVLINSGNGNVNTVKVTSPKSEPYMLSPNVQGTMVAVEFSGNNSVGFYSLPDLSYMGMVRMPSTVVAQRGVFTPNGSYYLEASADSNEVAVISTSSFSVVNTINLPSTSTPGLSGIAIAPGGQYAFTVIHGNVNTGGMIVLISLSSMSVAYQVPLSTAPSFVVPMTGSAENYLVNNVLLPPVTGLHC
ncbi:YncE family protein [Sulfuracidifex tepidarius]|uniref:YncE family protein n=1 Tax=Sulfuracidifex tepidarius TaxID=1294262 RepID=A0A510E5H8_9CREN|nr:YncE family protein [Sulfuracidifex tepidarius]BBG27736.1 hypothetical protein IC007_2290 [Sulfuracidifex tepidarius]